MKFFRECKLSFPLLACLCLTPSLSFGAKGQPVSSFLAGCEQILAGLEGSSTERLIAFIKKLVHKRVFSQSALEYLMESSSPLDLLKVDFQNLSIVEQGALQQALKVLLSSNQVASMDWERVKKEIRGFSEQAREAAKTRDQIEEETSPIFVGILKETFPRTSELVSVSPEGSPLFSRRRPNNPADPDPAERYVIVNLRTGTESPPVDSSHYGRFSDGTLYGFDHSGGSASQQTIFLKDVFKGKTKDFLQNDLDLYVHGVDYSPSWHLYTNSQGHKSVALWVKEERLARLALIDLETGHFEKHRFEIKNEDELGAFFADSSGQVYIIKFLSQSLHVEKVGQPEVKFNFPLQIDPKVLTPLSYVFNGPDGKIYLCMVSAPNELTVINFTDGVQKTFKNVYSETSFGWPEDLTRSADGKTYLTTYGQPYHGTGGTVFNLTDMTSQNFIFPPSVSRPKSAQITLHTVHLKNGKSFALAALKGQDYIDKIIVNQLGDNPLVYEFPITQFEVRSADFIGATADGKGIEGFFNSHKGLKRIQLFGTNEKK